MAIIQRRMKAMFKLVTFFGGTRKRHSKVSEAWWLFYLKGLKAGMKPGIQRK